VYRTRLSLRGDGLYPPDDWNDWSAEDQQSWIYKQAIQNAEKIRKYEFALKSWEETSTRLLAQLTSLRSRL
jgi:hypothetical protein